jgi:glycosyltransferase involved in cell wall biosynthesis
MTTKSQNKKLMLISFNTKEGMKLIMDCYINYFSDSMKVTAISDRDYEPDIIGSEIADDEFDLYRLSHSRNHLLMAMDVFNLFLISRIIFIYIKTKPNTCYFISAHPLNSTILTLFKLFTIFFNPSAKFFSHIHDVKPHAGSEGYAFIDLFQFLQIHQSDIITVYGESLKKMLSSRFNVEAGKILVTPHGVNRLRVSKENKSPIQSSLKYITLTGRLDKYKGIDLFLDAAHYFKKENSNILFLLAGRGNLIEYQDRISSLTNIVVINRFLTNDEVDDVILKSFTVVLPYIDASQSGVIPIAYYNSCPVIVTNVGALPEVVVEGETGYIIEKGDCLQLINRIQNIVDNSDLRDKMGDNSYNYYRDKLRWSVIINNLSTLMMK